MLIRRLRWAVALAAGLIAVTESCPAQPFPSFLLDTTVNIQPEAEDVVWTSVAMGNDTGLVAWTDGEYVKACRVTSELQLLDSLCLHLTSPASTSVPDVSAACCHDSFLAVWTGAGTQGPTVAGALVTPEGRVARRFNVDSTGNFAHMEPQVAASPEGYLVAWDAFRQSGGEEVAVYCRRVSPSGVVIDPLARAVAFQTGSQSSCRVAWGDTSYLVVWRGQNLGDTGIFCNIIRRDGNRGSTAGFLVAQESSWGRQAVCFDGTNFVVVWEHWEQGCSIGVFRAARVNQAAVVLDTGGVGLPPPLTADRRFSVAGDQDTTLLVWSALAADTWWTYGMRLDARLRPLDSVPVRLSGPYVGLAGQQGASCAATRGSFISAWAQFVGPEPYYYNRSVLGRRVRTDGSLPDSAAALLSYSSNHTVEHDVATDGQSFLAVWVEYRKVSSLFDRYLYRRMFDSQGRMLDSAPLLLAHDAADPVVTYGAGCYLAAWSDRGPQGIPFLTAARIAPTGALIDTTPLQFPFAADPTGVACAESVFLVVWDGLGPTGYPNILGARIHRDGRALDTVPLILQPSPNGIRRNPRVASDGDKLFVVTRTMGNTGGYGGFLRCDRDGVILDTAETILIHITGDSYWFLPVAHGDDGFLITANQPHRPIGLVWLLDSAGLHCDTIGVRSMGSTPVFDGTNYVVFEAFPDFLGAIRVSPAGRLLDSSDIKLAILDTVLRISRGLPCAASSQSGVTGALLRSYEVERYGSTRLRAVVFPTIGLAEATQMAVGHSVSVFPNPVRGVLYVPSRPDSSVAPSLLDVSGRRVMPLLPGPNDVRALSPGVYFVREASAVRKVIVTE